MANPATLHLLLAPLVLGQYTVPASAPTRSTNPSNKSATNTTASIDLFFPDTASNQANDPLEEALGTNIPTSVRTVLDELKAHHLGERLWFYLKDEGASRGDSIYLLPGNGILRLAPFPDDLRIYIYDAKKKNWTEIGSRTNDPDKPYSNPQISDGIKAILESREERGWVSPKIREKSNKNNLEIIIRHPDFTKPLTVIELTELAEKIRTNNAAAAKLLEDIIDNDNVLNVVDKNKDGKISKEEIIELAKLAGDTTNPELTEDDFSKIVNNGGRKS